MTVIVTACSAFGLTVSESKTDIMRLQTKGGGKVSFTIKAAGQVYKQSSLCTWVGLFEPVAPVAYQVILELGVGQFREFKPRRVHTRINSLGLFLEHKLTFGQRESVS